MSYPGNVQNEAPPPFTAMQSNVGAPGGMSTGEAAGETKPDPTANVAPSAPAPAPAPAGTAAAPMQFVPAGQPVAGQPQPNMYMAAPAGYGQYAPQQQYQPPPQGYAGQPMYAPAGQYPGQYAGQPGQPMMYSPPPQHYSPQPQQPAMSRDGGAQAGAYPAQPVGAGYPGAQSQGQQYAQPQGQQGGSPVQGQPQPQPMQGGQPVMIVASPMFFGNTPQMCNCFHCRQNVTTQVSHKAGGGTWLMCCGLACFGCWLGCCLIPFCVPDCQDAYHQCPHCKTIVGKKTFLNM